MIIEVDISNKIAQVRDKTIVGVCGNSDYVVHFSFDEEWNAYETKTARFKWNGEYTDVVFTGSECPMPIIYNTNTLEIGVYAGELHTTTAAVLYMKKSVLCGSGIPTEPTEDVYNQIMEKLNSLDGVQPATADKLGGIKVGENLSITEDGTLSADASEVEIDNQTIVKDADGRLKANVSLQSPTKDGSLLIGSGAGSSDAKWTEADAAGGYGYKKISDPIVFTPDKYEAAEKVYYTDEDTGEQIAFLVKASDDVITLEEAKSMLTIETVYEDETYTVDIAANSDYLVTFGTTGIYFMYGMSCEQDESLADMLEMDVTVSRGTWILAETAQEHSSMTIKHGLVHKISSDYIPSNVVMVNRYSIQSDEQFETEIREKFKAGMTVLVDNCLVLSVSDSGSSDIHVEYGNYDKPSCKKSTLTDGSWTFEDLFLSADALEANEITPTGVSSNKVPSTWAVYNLVNSNSLPSGESAGDGALLRYDATLKRWVAVTALGGYGYRKSQSTEDTKNKIDSSYLPDNTIKYYTIEHSLPHYSSVKEALEQGYTLYWNNDDGGHVIDWEMTIDEDPLKSVFKFVFDRSPTVRRIYTPFVWTQGDSSTRISLTSYTAQAIQQNMYLKSATGKTFKITVDGIGTLSATEVTS